VEIQMERRRAQAEEARQLIDRQAQAHQLIDNLDRLAYLDQAASIMDQSEGGREADVID
jgi:hypothetical protein